MTFIDNIRGAYAMEGTESDRGDIIQFVVIAAIVVVAAVAIAGWVMTAAMNRGADLSNCVEGANGYSADKTKTACDKNHASEGTNSYSKQKSYEERF